ncbi:low specificity L-threonine aldolase [Halomicrobium sp. HM KBTZ05]|uniref:threonine aldolase family protein n=1 Tax=Halomicrobium sp. HM KBTZ05 TaxID=3242663 RepID=UPI0035578CD6
MSGHADTIDLRSDTVTRPSTAMREAARNAPVGDDVYGEDPTVAELESRAADLLGKADALFVPSGTMGNQIAVRAHTERGQELLLDRESHIYRWELGGTAQHAQLQCRTVDAEERCVPTPEQINEAFVAEDLHRPGTGLVTLENTHNYRGGVAVPEAHVDAACDAAHALDVPVHLDGARLWNAAVALDTTPAALAREADSVMACLSKGLGAPVGSVLAGTESFVDEARRLRKLFGGGMRQAGMIAAPGLEALDNVDRLADDHENARRLATGLDAIDGLRVPTPETNIVVVDSEPAGITSEAFVEACVARGVRCGSVSEYTTRLCTNLDVDRADIDAAIDRIGRVVRETTE